jgi:alkylated DNA repair dioxygenase AlkB
LLEGTQLQDPAKNYNFGIFTVREGMGKKNADEYYQLLDQDFEFLCKKDRDAKGQNRKRKAVAITAGSTKEYTGYETFQCTSHNCSCKYDYAKTKDHDHYVTEELVAPKRFVDTLNFLGKKRQCIVDEVVANSYSPSQRTPPHTDYAPIYARCTSIVSASFGNAAIFAWKVRPPKAEHNEDLPSFANQHPLWSALGGPKKRGDARRQEMIKTLGYAGAVALFHGDILVMEGTFQTHFDHETLVIDSINSLEELLALYPATIQQSQQLIATALSQKQVFDKRLNLTARLISNHKTRCGNYIGKTPIGHQPNDLTVGMMPRAPAPPRHPDKTQVVLRSYRPCQRPPPPHPPF